MGQTGDPDPSVADYVVSDYLSTSEQENEADVPVPDNLLPETQIRELVRRLKRSQKVGLLMWLESIGRITLGGRARLLSLQEGSSVEALLAARKFFARISSEKKLQKDFSHCMRFLNSRPRSATFRRTQKRRIGVGYRDKGTLPSFSSGARQDAHKAAWILREDVNEFTVNAIQSIAPFTFSDDGEFLDSHALAQYLKPVWALPELWGSSS